MTEKAVRDLLYRMADDQLILGHRNSEWTGLGPLLEEDIAFSSMAQDKIGHSLAFYELLQAMGEGEPDKIAFLRSKEKFKNCQLTELPNEDYAFSLVRHFLFDNAELLRMKLLSESKIDELKELGIKIKGELIYHVLHADTWMRKLAKGDGEAKARMQVALDKCMPYALGIFEPGENEKLLIDEGIFAGEEQLRTLWIAEIQEKLSSTDLTFPDAEMLIPVFGGRKGQHTEYLQPLLDEMSEVLRIDPDAEW